MLKKSLFLCFAFFVIAMTNSAQGAILTANIAKDGVAYANQPLYGGGNPRMLIDGNKGPQIHGDVNIQPGYAYTIDLGKDYAVSELKIYPRQDGCCPERLTNFRVSVHTDVEGAMGPEVWGANQFTDGSNPGSGANLVFSVVLPSLQTGRWIEIRSLADPVPNYALQITEVEVFAEVQPGEVNRALGAVATANQGTWPGTTAANITDGNRVNQVHGLATITPGFAYDINLGTEVTMDRIVIFPRQDGCCPDRLSNYRVAVYTDNNGQIGNLVWSADMHTDLSNPGATFGDRDTLTAELDAAGTFKGQWLRIQSLDDPVPAYALQISEVEVYGTIPPAVVLTINSEPLDAAAGTGRSANFAVGVNLINGDPALITYQWQKGGVDIAGATSATYTVPLVLSADSGSKYRVIVFYPGKTPLTSREATLRVNYAVGATTSANGPIWGGGQTAQLVDGSRSPQIHGEASPPTGFAYELRLGAVVNFDVIDIYPRQDGCCPERLSNFRVSVHDDSTTEPGTIGAKVWSADLYTDGSNPGATAGSVVHVLGNMDPTGTFRGRWIRIEDLTDPVPAYALQINEIEAFGTLLDATPQLTISQQSTVALGSPGRSAVISVTASIFNGNPTNITYQWKREGIPITGATNKVYQTPILQQSDLGAKYSVVVSYPGVGDKVSADIPVEFDFNYARGGLAYTNRKLWVGVPSWDISLIIDGDRSTYVHGDTAITPGYAYEINMRDEVTLEKIDIYPRQDGCCPTRLSNIRVSIHKDNGGTIGDVMWSADLFTLDDNAGSGPGVVVTLTPELDPAGTFKGQWIRILALSDPLADYALQINEVEAIGTIAVRPQLTWSAAGGLTLTWNVGILESASAVTGSWNPVTGASSPYLVPRSDPQTFFRIKKE